MCLQKLLDSIRRKRETKIDPVLLGTQIVEKYGGRIANYVRRQKVPEITFSVTNDTNLQIAGTAGTNIILRKEYFRKITNTEARGIIIHEVAHAIQQAKQGGKGWLIEALADFVRLQLGYGKSEWKKGDPRSSGYGSGAYFFKWLHDNKNHMYIIIVDAMNEGIVPKEINQIVDDYLVNA